MSVIENKCILVSGYEHYKEIQDELIKKDHYMSIPDLADLEWRYEQWKSFEEDQYVRRHNIGFIEWILEGNEYVKELY